MIINDDVSREIREFENERQKEFEEAEQEAKRKNSNFVQFYKSQIKHLRKLVNEDPVASEIFMFLVEHMGRTNAVICSYRVLEEALDYSRSTIYRGVRTLKDKRFIKLVKVGNATVFHINAQLAWSSWSTGKKYAALNGQILIAESEQDEPEDLQQELIPLVITKTVYEPLPEIQINEEE